MVGPVVGPATLMSGRRGGAVWIDILASCGSSMSESGGRRRPFRNRSGLNGSVHPMMSYPGNQHSE